jgi:integrase/recombinase XerD
MTKSIVKTPYQNEQIKREFFDQLRHGRGFTKNSINAFADAITQWQTFAQGKDFSQFTKERAAAFVEYLSTRPAKTKTGKIALVTQNNYLRRVKKFFEWLSEQPGYKSKIKKGYVEWLRLSKSDAHIARMATTRREPTFEEIKIIIQKIKGENELDLRDRALICLAILTGARISALASLKMKSFDKKEKILYQSPKDGVKTKSTKLIPTIFFPTGWDEPERYFIEWYEYLESKGFKPDDPIFPATLNCFSDKGNIHSKEAVSKKLWNGSGAARKIFQKRCLDAGVPYFNPHSFRHSVVDIFMERNPTEKQKKAFSMNIGHESVTTTFASYGNSSMTQKEAIEIIKKMRNAPDNSRKNLVTDAEMKIVIAIRDAHKQS